MTSIWLVYASSISSFFTIKIIIISLSNITNLLILKYYANINKLKKILLNISLFRININDSNINLIVVRY